MTFLLRRSPPLLGLLLLLALASPGQAAYEFTTFQGPGSINTQPYGINDQGVISGLWADSGGVFHGFLYQNGNFKSLDVPANLNAFGTNLYQGNSAGGFYAGGYQDNTAAGYYHAAVYNSSTGLWTILPDPSPSSQFTEAGGINNKGQVSGNWTTSYNATTGVLLNNTGWIYQNNSYTFFNVPGSSSTGIGTIAFGINDAGTVVGEYQDSNGFFRGFERFSNGTFLLIDDPNADLTQGGTQAFGINNLGQIVGEYYDANGFSHGFVLNNGVYTTVDFPGQANSWLAGINDSGVLVGDYFFLNSNGAYENHAFIVDPTVPEPSSLFLLALGGAGLVSWCRFRSRRVA